MTTDALAQAIAERDAAWNRYSKYSTEPTLRNLSFYQDYLEAAASLRAICPHDRFEERGYGTAVCVVCGKER